MNKQYTLQKAEVVKYNMLDNFMEEVKHLLNSGAVDENNHSSSDVFRVALENIASKYPKGKDYDNLRKF